MSRFGKRDKKEAEQGDQAERTPIPVFSLTTDTHLAERIFDSSHEVPLLAVCEPDGNVYCTPELDIGATIYSARVDTNELISQRIVSLPSFPEDYGGESELVSLILRYIHRYADVPEFWERLICAYVMMTWVYDRFTAVPYLRFLGEWQSGKSRLAYVAASIAYRACFVSGATSPAALYRLIQMFRGCLAVDEADYDGNSELWSDVAKIFNAGYMRGNPVLKCDKDNTPEAFDVFCPKILSARKRFADQGTESRCLTLLTYQKTRIRPDISLHLPDTFRTDAEAIRNRLLMWRFRNWSRIKVDKTTEAKLAGLEPRMIQILSPLVAVSADPQFPAQLVNHFSMYSAQQRADSPQAIIVEAIRQMLGTRPPERKNLSVLDVAQRASEIRASQEPEAAREAAKNGKGEDALYFSAKRAGHLIRALGMSATRTKTGYVFEMTRERMAELSEQYPPASSRVGLV